jgi:DNA (cytosine-5)-methyltransferase 1
MRIPVIDLFAGAGGLGEGFSKATSVDFHIVVSIEKEEAAFETLRLRAAHRSLERVGADARTWAAWDALVADCSWNATFDALRACRYELLANACAVAATETWHLELGPSSREQVSSGIRSRLRSTMPGQKLPDNAVLIGGPPCQAYSIAGRSRNRGVEGYRAENDHRHFLYREYLEVISEFRPAVFVMENVKGILSSRVADRQIFQSLTADLQRPDLACGVDAGLEYVLVALPHGSASLFEPAPVDYIVEAERYGVPQARHRVIICGIRRDVHDRAGSVPRLRPVPAESCAGDVLADLPPLRPDLSFRGKDIADWNEVLRMPIMEDALKSLRSAPRADLRRVASRMEYARRDIEAMSPRNTGSDRVTLDKCRPQHTGPLQGWFRDRPICLLTNHQSRSHMPEDLVRYLFVSTYGRETGESPRLEDFPLCLLPAHNNVDPRAPGDAIFRDRFRVQIAERCSTTVTSHIGKDGHAFIHPDPSQCRSLTVREAARLQTFPDSYVFMGTRTSQYMQVGNAVPPYLARQIADLVGSVLTRAGFANAREAAAAMT